MKKSLHILAYVLIIPFTSSLFMWMNCALIHIFYDAYWWVKIIILIQPKFSNLKNQLSRKPQKCFSVKQTWSKKRKKKEKLLIMKLFTKQKYNIKIKLFDCTFGNIQSECE